MTVRSDKPPRRRGLNHTMAAAYVGVSPARFTELMEQGRMPRPKLIDDAIRVWDVVELDIYFEALPTDERTRAQRTVAGRNLSNLNDTRPMAHNPPKLR